MTVHWLVALVLISAEPMPVQESSIPSQALLMYLDEFSSVDDEFIDLAVICTNPSDQQNEHDLAVHELVDCEPLPENPLDRPEPTNSENNLHEQA